MNSYMKIVDGLSGEGENFDSRQLHIGKGTGYECGYGCGSEEDCGQSDCSDYVGNIGSGKGIFVACGGFDMKGADYY